MWAMSRLVLVVHNVRSALNVGSILRTAEGLGVEKVFLTGYTPYPETPGDGRLPHLRQKMSRQIHKTALGAEYFVGWQHIEDINACLDKLEADGYLIVALEQTPHSKSLSDYSKQKRLVLVVGNEVSGLDKSLLERIKNHVQIPMRGRKESFNVAIAAAVAVYHLRYLS